MSTAPSVPPARASIPSQPTFLEAWWVVGIVLLGLVLRIAVVALRPTELNLERDAYLGMAQGLWAGRGLSVPGTTQPTAYRPPLYPVLLAPISAQEQAWLRGVVQIILGTATVVLVWPIARGLGCSRGEARIAAGLVAIDPLLLLYTPQLMTETLATCLAAGGLALLTGEPEGWSRRRQVAAGFTLGLAGLCRPTFFLWAAVLACWIAGRAFIGPAADRGGVMTRLRRLPWLLLGTLLLTVAPWPIRNAVRMGRPIVTTTHGGYTLLLSNNETYDAEVVRPRTGAVWSGPSLDRWQRDLQARMAAEGVSGELAQDRWMKTAALRWITSHPVRFLAACGQRLTSFWRISPGRETGPASAAAWAVMAFYGAEWVLVLLGLWGIRGTGSRFLPGLLLIATLSAAHLVYFSNARMRAPLVPVLAILAARGCRGLRMRGKIRLPEPAGPVG